LTTDQALTTAKRPTADERPGFIAMVRRANAPGPPERSQLFRIATLVAVLTGVFACVAEGEISSLTGVAAAGAISVGMVFSSVTIDRPKGWVKIVLAISVLVVFTDFVAQVLGAGRTGELSSVEAPLAGLFTWVQVVHAFDVPARRDLLFSVAAAGALVTVAGAQAVSGGFLVYVVIWLVASVVALGCSWRSMSGGVGPLPAGGLIGATIIILIAAVLLDAVVPAPQASQQITLPHSLTSYISLPLGGGLTQGGANPAEPAHAGRPAGVGGYVGMSGPLDTALRGSLGDEIVMRVRATTPGYFLGLTYTNWSGQDWTNSKACPTDVVRTGSPFELPTAPYASPGASQAQYVGPQNIQTFYVEQPLPNVLFGTSSPDQIYFPAHDLVLSCDSIRSTIAMTPGTVYTVISEDSELTPAQLRSVPASATTAITVQQQFAQDLELPSPDPYAKVRALTVSIIARAHATTLVGEVQALENWIGAHTQYTTDPPPLPTGEDAVNEFLFHTRLGFCEQISTALAVMLRSIGVPTREATGYIPGSFDPLSDLYDIQAKDAHAWVQVYFPGYGWQNFDPTAYVPLAPPDPGAVLLSDIGHDIAGLPWLPIGSCAALAAVVMGRRFAIRRRRLLPTTWAGRLALRLERAGRRGGLPRGLSETLPEYAIRLHGAAPDLEGLDGVVRLVLESAYAGRDVSPQEQLNAERIVKSLRRAIGRASKSVAAANRRSAKQRLGLLDRGPALDQRA
jgi:protein-glutamine gamma-glutamyltransferase